MQAVWPMFVIGVVALIWSGMSAARSYSVFMGDSLDDADEREQNVVAATLFFHVILVGATGVMVRHHANVLLCMPT